MHGFARISPSEYRDVTRVIYYYYVGYSRSWPWAIWTRPTDHIQAEYRGVSLKFARVERYRRAEHPRVRSFVRAGRMGRDAADAYKN